MIVEHERDVFPLDSVFFVASKSYCKAGSYDDHKCVVALSRRIRERDRAIVRGLFIFRQYSTIQIFRVKI